MTTEQKLETYESQKGLDIQPGLYPGTVAEVEPVEGQFGRQWRFAFSLDDYPDERPWAWASAKLGTKTKLFGWVTTLLGRQLAIGERFGPSDLIGKRCQVLVVERLDADGEPRRVVDNILRDKAVAPSLPEGSFTHSVCQHATDEMVKDAWKTAEEMGASVATCLCCKGPTKLDTELCRWCRVVAPAQ